MSETIREYDVDGFHVRISKEEDPDPDLSFLGEYKSQTPELPYFDRALGKVVKEYSEEDLTEEEETTVRRFESRREYRYIAVGTGDPDYLEQDAKRLVAYPDEWYMVGVRAVVTKEGIELAEKSIWGIESDSEESFFQEEARTVAEEALREARAVLERLCK